MSVYSKCERVKRDLKEHFSYVSVNYDSDEPDTASRCTIDADDRELSSLLAEYDKAGGAWATAHSVAITKNKVQSSDIVVNQALCGRTSPKSKSWGGTDKNSKWRMPHVDKLADLPYGCKVKSLHVHNKNDNNPAAHLHIECEDSTYETLSKLTELIVEANQVSWRMCGEDKPEPEKKKAGWKQY